MLNGDCCFTLTHRYKKRSTFHFLHSSFPHMRILFTGGGTGGHLIPLVAVVREIRDIAEEERILDTQFFYIGPETPGDDILAKEGVAVFHITAGKIHSSAPLANMASAIKIIWGTLQAAWKLFVLMPDAVFAKGGYGSFPVLFVARLYRIPVMIHESDIIPGRVTRWAGRFAKRIAVSFEKTAALFPPEKTAVTGSPIRKRILGGNLSEARDEFKTYTGKPVILFLGGSQGSRTLNESVLEILKELVKRYEIIHQAGPINFQDVSGQAKIILEDRVDDYHVSPFLNEGELRSAYLLADLIVSRAGSTIFEIAAWGKPCILVPLKDSAQDHQRENAYEYGRAGAAVIIEEANLTPSILLHEIDSLMADGDRRKRMAITAQKFSRIDSTEVIAREILKLGLH